MLKNDFLVKQLEQFIQEMIDLLLRPQKSMTTTSIDYTRQGCELLGLSEKDLSSHSADQLIELFSGQSLSMEKMEAAAYLLLAIRQKEKTYELLSYVNQHSNSYSINRNAILSELADSE